MNAPEHPTLLFCATDPGGARNLAPVVRLAAESFNPHILGSTQTVDILNETGLNTGIAEIADVEGAVRFLSNLKPSALIIGTSAADRPEALLTIAARSLRIPAIAVLDEWYYYAARFAAPDGTFTHLADVICCQDELAHTEAIAEGIPADHLQITGSPALAETYRQIHTDQGERPIRPRKTIPQIILISEQIARAFGEAPGERGFVGPYIGYSELSVRHDIAAALSELDTPSHVSEKLHPNETGIVAAPEHGASVSWSIIPSGVGLRDATADADIVIGMRSIALLEAAMMGFRPASYQPGRIGADQCTAARLGLADSIGSAGDLKDWLKNAMANERSEGATQDTPAFAAPEAAANIYEVIRRICAGPSKIGEVTT